MLGILDCQLVMIEDDNKITQSINVEFWILQEGQGDQGFFISISNSQHQILIIFPD